MIGQEPIATLTPAALPAGQTHNYRPIDAVTGKSMSTASVIRQATHASGSSLTGLAPKTNSLVILDNLGPGPLTLLHQQTSAEGYRLSLPEPSVVIPSGNAALLRYDHATLSYRPAISLPSTALSLSSITVSGDIASSSTTATALSIPGGGIYAKYALFGYGGDNTLGVIGTTNLEVLRFTNLLIDTVGADIETYTGAGGGNLERVSYIQMNPTADITWKAIQGAGDRGRVMFVQNTSDTYSITFPHLSAGKDGNWFNFPSELPFVLEPRGLAMFQHDLTGSALSAGDAWKLTAWACTRWPRLIVDTRLYFGSPAGPVVMSGTGSPEGSVTAPIGSLYLRSDGGANTSHYAKESGVGNTGWVAK